MKAAPTLDERIRIDLESETDLMVLRSAPLDARLGSDHLMDHLSHQMPQQFHDDWREFVLPDLREQFDSQLQNVIESLAHAEIGEPVFITHQLANAWYGTLNQARLAIEEKYRISEQPDLADMSDEPRFAAIRSQLYMSLQGLILEFLIDAD